MLVFEGQADSHWFQQVVGLATVAEKLFAADL